MRRILTVTALCASVTLAGCVNKDGSTDWGSTLALGAGVGLGAALIAVAASGDGGRHRDRGYSRRGGGYGGYTSHDRRYAYSDGRRYR
ncbi:MAG: hypothetical protein V4653_20055 [Pseudomonadota bacterium]